MNDLLYAHKPKKSVYFSLTEEGGPMVLALDDSSRIAKDLNFKALTRSLQ